MSTHLLIVIRGYSTIESNRLCYSTAFHLSIITIRQSLLNWLSITLHIIFALSHLRLTRYVSIIHS